MLLKNAMESHSFALAPTGGIIHEIKFSDSFFFTGGFVIQPVRLADVHLLFREKKVLADEQSDCPRECNKVVHVVATLGL
jgi:hypothetical protein